MKKLRRIFFLLRRFLLSLLLSEDERFLLLEALTLKEKKEYKNRVENKYYDSMYSDDDLFMIVDIRDKLNYDKYLEKL